MSSLGVADAAMYDVQGAPNLPSFRTSDGDTSYNSAAARGHILSVTQQP